jgi:hypothetical protein
MEAHFHSILTSAVSGHLHALAVVDLRNSGTYVTSTSGDNGPIKQVENSRIFTYEIVSYMICSCIFQQRAVFYYTIWGHSKRKLSVALHYLADQLALLWDLQLGLVMFKQAVRGQASARIQLWREGEVTIVSMETQVLYERKMMEITHGRWMTSISCKREFSLPACVKQVVNQQPI